jgi:hypothetical protein
MEVTAMPSSSLDMRVDAAFDNLPADVREFVAAHHLTPLVLLSLRLAHENFEPIKRTRVELQDDPETGERRVLVELTVGADESAVLAMKKSYARAWVAAAPPVARDRVRLLYYFA